VRPENWILVRTVGVGLPCSGYDVLPHSDTPHGDITTQLHAFPRSIWGAASPDTFLRPFLDPEAHAQALHALIEAVGPPLASLL
jgi:hypothetical protein